MARRRALGRLTESFAATLIGGSLLLTAAPVGAQAGPPPGHRPFTADTLRGTLIVRDAPWVSFNGQPDRLAPGARIRGADNLLRTPASLAGASLQVHVRREQATGLLREVWVLNDSEIANQPWPRTPDEASRGLFDAATQRWTLP
jgi:hypothetical protein